MTAPAGPAVDACLCACGIVLSPSGATLLIMVTAVDQEISGGSKMAVWWWRLGFRFSLESWVFFWVFFWWVSKWVWLFSCCIEIGCSLGSDTERRWCRSCRWKVMKRVTKKNKVKDGLANLRQPPKAYWLAPNKSGGHSQNHNLQFYSHRAGPASGPIRQLLRTSSGNSYNYKNIH